MVKLETGRQTDNIKAQPDEILNMEVNLCVAFKIFRHQVLHIEKTCTLR